MVAVDAILKTKKMAKRRRAKKTTRRRRIGAAGKLNANSPLVKFGSMAAGYFLGDKINEQIEKVTGDKIDGKIVAGLEVLGGLILGGTIKLGKSGAKPKLPMVVIGGVLAGAGLKKGLTEFGVINGFYSVPVVNGYRSVPALNGYNPTPGSQMNGYRVPNRMVMGAVSVDASGSGINPTDR